MQLTPQFEKTLRRYVLGDLEEGLRAELEEMLITDAEAFEALGVIEDELIEEYLDGACSAAERERFEQHFLASPERSRRVAIVRALKDRAARPTLVRAAGRASASKAWQPAWIGLAATLALSLGANLWLISRPSVLPELAVATAPPQVSHPRAPMPMTTAPSQVPSPRGPMEAAPRYRNAIADPDDQPSRAPEVAPLASIPPQALPADTAPAQNRQAPLERPRPVLSFALAAGLLRAGGSLPRVTLPADTLIVQLRLELPGNDYPFYRAVLQDVDGNEIWAAARLRAIPGKAEIAVPVPAALLPRGDYQLKLSGVSEGGEPEAVEVYAFRVSPA